jgi:hypothetical protein
VEFESPTPRRVGKPSWLDLRLVLGVMLVIGSVLLGARLIAGAQHTDKHLAVTRDLAAGTTLRADDLRAVDVQLPSGQGALYLADVDRAVGKTLSRPLAAGELLPNDAVADAPSRTTVDVPLSADAAPVLTRGQRIELWVSTASCQSVVLLLDVTVQDVRAADTGSFASSGAGQQVVLSVAPDLAERVVHALAIDGATIRAGVLSGAGTATQRNLPDLAVCSATATP